ncbi:MAG: hypothetical protein ACYDH6_22170 [Acidimicrobiales bacterium]
MAIRPLLRRRRNLAGVVALAVLSPILGLRGAAATPAPQPSGPTVSPQAAPSGFDFGAAPYSEPGAPRRASFTLDGAAGSTLRDKVALINDGLTPKVFYLYPADAYTTEIGGGFALRDRGDKPIDAGAWINMAVKTYTVPAQTASVIPFTLTIPLDASPGDHTAGLVAEEVVGASKISNGAGVTTIHRVAARVYLRVAGTLHPGLHVDSFVTPHHVALLAPVTGKGDAAVAFLVSNTGNVRVSLSEVDVSLRGVFGRQLHSKVLRPGKATPTEQLPSEILPGGKVRLGVVFSGLPVIDHVTAKVTLKAQDVVAHELVTSQRTRVFWVIPWLDVAVVLVLIALLVIVRRRRTGRAGDARVALPGPGAAPTPVSAPVRG